jgi:hypothetical protein
MQWYHARQQELEEQLQMMERMMEDNEAKHLSEIQRERDLREAADSCNSGNLADSNKLLKTLQEREKLIELRERELNVTERELKIPKDAKIHDTDTDSDSDSAPMIFCSGNISDAETNVILDLADILDLEKRLRNDRFQIATVTSLFESYVTRSPSLLEHLNTAKSRFSVEWALNGFLREFTALVKVRKSATIQVIKVLCLARISESMKTKVKSAVKYASSIRLEILKTSVSVVKKDGLIPATDSVHDVKTLRELPGIIQLLDPLLSKASRCDHWTSIGEFVCEVACFVNDRKERLSTAKQCLDDFVGTGFIDFDLFVSEFERRFNICTSWFKKPIESDFDKIQRMLTTCPQIVKMKYADRVTDSKTDFDEFAASWTEFRSFIQDIWKCAFQGVQLQRSLGIGPDTTSISYSAAATNNTVPVRAPLDSSPSSYENAFKDINIRCVICATDFQFSSSQQMEYKKKGYENHPKRCPKCRGQVCDLFSTPEGCTYGDNCKFLHPAAAPDSGNDTTAGSPLKAAQPAPRRKYPCHFFEAGRCDKGDSCPFSHDKAPDKP